MMKIVSVWNPKGGQGKSLLSLNLAACAVSIFDLTPLIIDQDPQGTCQECSNEGKLTFKVIGEIPKDKPKGIDLVIIDHQASDWELPDTKILVMPVFPTRTQFKTYSRAYTLAKKSNKNIITVVNNVDMNRKQERNAAKELRQVGAFILQKGSPFGHAESHLSTIFDSSISSIKDSYKVKERKSEIEAILTAILREK
ncbi:MAG: ParA family protein [Pseudomonadales bacterium]|nr:ParA family protein [Pseudomonadales bacterium]